MRIKSKILVIAGSDSSGGAGIQADIKTITSLGSYAMTAITAVTVQNTKGVKSVFPIPADEIKNQILYSAKDIKPNAIKIGMLHSVSVIKKVLFSLKKLKINRVVLDPVINIPEAEVLTGIKIENKKDMIIAGKKIIKLGAKNVLIKGGHLKTREVIDIYLNNSDLKVFTNPRYKTRNTHGTGCTLSSAITVFFSCGKSIKKACELGIKYVNLAILSNPNYGKGHGPINHLNSIKLKKKFD